MQSFLDRRAVSSFRRLRWERFDFRDVGLEDQPDTDFWSLCALEVSIVWLVGAITAFTLVKAKGIVLALHYFADGPKPCNIAHR